MKNGLRLHPPRPSAAPGYKVAELLVGSPLATALDTDAPEVVTVTPGEKMTVHLSRALLYAGMNTVAGVYPTLNMAEHTGVTALSVYGTGIPLLRGTAANPGGIFSPRRQRQWFDLGWWDLSSADTILATLELQGTAIVADAAIALPCLPANARFSIDVNPKTLGPSLIAGSSLADSLAAAGSANLDFVATEDGLLDLTGASMFSLADSNIEADGQLHIDALGTIQIDGITLPSSVPLLIGSNTPVAPAALFAVDRTFDWVDFGVYYVTSGQTVRISVTNNGADAASVAWQAPWWPINELKARGIALPSSCG